MMDSEKTGCVFIAIYFVVAFICLVVIDYVIQKVLGHGWAWSYIAMLIFASLYLFLGMFLVDELL